MIISLIAAMGRNHVIGRGNALPWHLPADLRHFKQLTLGKPILMGRKTFVSIGRPLPGRTNLIVTRDGHFHAPGCIVVHSIEAALNEVADSEEVMVIGGASFYQQMASRAQRMYLTLIDEEFEGDAYFPAWDPVQWHELSREARDPDKDNPYPYVFVTLERNSP